jgi:23S rRNA pseudouridine1911/1915/1917 synthase
MIDSGRVLVDGRPAAKAGLVLSPGMEVLVELPAPDPGTPPAPEPIEVDIAFEDEHLVVVRKPAGLVVHPGAGRKSGTLVNALAGRGVPLALAGGRDRPGIVHRLDADTSGLLVVAKTDEAHRELVRAFAERRVTKRYVALVWGRPDPEEGTIETSIGRSRGDPTRMSVHSRRGRPARTTYRVIESLPGFSLLRVGIETGRTHQIRVHLQSIHHPVVGDTRYGGQQGKGVRSLRKRRALQGFGRLALHAAELAFPHPVTGKNVRVRAALPEDLEDLLSVLRDP